MAINKQIMRARQSIRYGKLLQLAWDIVYLNHRHLPPEETLDFVYRIYLFSKKMPFSARHRDMERWIKYGESVLSFFRANNTISESHVINYLVSKTIELYKSDVEVFKANNKDRTNSESQNSQDKQCISSSYGMC